MKFLMICLSVLVEPKSGLGVLNWVIMFGYGCLLENEYNVYECELRL